MLVISPADIRPRSGDGAGNSPHRRIIASGCGGPASIDIGYYNFRKGRAVPAYA